MSLHRKIYWTDGNTINMANMDGSNSKVLHQNQRDPAGSPSFFSPLILRCDTARVPSFSLVLAAENHTSFYPHVVESCCKIFDSFTVLVAVKAQHVSTASTGVASNTQGHGADVINAQQRLSFRLEASDWLSRQGSV